MSQEELNEQGEAREEPAAEAPAPGEVPAEGEVAAKPKKVMPKVPKGMFKKAGKADLSAAKGRFAPLKGGPVKKQSLDRFAKKGGPNKKVLLAIVAVAVVLVVIFMFFGAGVKSHAVYINARNTLHKNPEVIKQFYGRELEPGELPRLTEGNRATATYGKEQKYDTIEIENSVSGEKHSGSFKVKGIKYRGLWRILRIEVTVDNGYNKVLTDLVLTDTGIRPRQ